LDLTTWANQLAENKDRQEGPTVIELPKFKDVPIFDDEPQPPIEAKESEMPKSKKSVGRPRTNRIATDHEKKITHAAAALFGKMLREKLGERVLGPVLPHVPRMRGYYVEEIMLKLEKSAPLLADAKGMIQYIREIVLGKPGFGQVMVGVDVDPM